MISNLFEIFSRLFFLGFLESQIKFQTDYSFFPTGKAQQTFRLSDIFGPLGIEYDGVLEWNWEESVGFEVWVLQQVLAVFAGPVHV